MSIFAALCLAVWALTLPQAAAAQIRLERLSVLTPPYGGFAPSHPVALALSPEDNLYLLDAQLAAVARLTLQGELITQAGGPGSGDLQFSDPADLSIFSGLDLFVADRGNDRIVRLNRRLNYLAQYSSGDNTPSDLAFEKPLSVLQNARGDLFIADGGNDRVLKISADGDPLFSFGAYGEEKGSLSQPRRLEADPSAGLWVLDSRGHAVHFDEFGGYVEELHSELTGKLQGLAVSPEAVWVCADTTVWAWDRAERSSHLFTSSQLGVSDSVTMVDLAYRDGYLWVLDSRGAIHRFQVRTEP